MKRLLLSILVIGILLLGACGAPQAEFVLFNLQVVPTPAGSEYYYNITIDVENTGGSTGTYNLADVAQHTEGEPLEVELSPGEKQTVRLETMELTLTVRALKYLSGIRDQNEYTVSVGDLTKTVDFTELELIPTTTSTEYQQIKEWSGGSGIKQTEPFIINESPWAVVWAHSPKQSIGIFQIYVYDTKGNLISLAANSMEKDSGVYRIYKTGTFYLEINAANTYWGVSVMAYQ